MQPEACCVVLYMEYLIKVLCSLNARYVSTAVLLQENKVFCQNLQHHYSIISFLLEEANQ